MRSAAVCSALLITGVLLLGGSAQPVTAGDDEVADESWERLVRRTADGATQHPYTGRVVVVSFEPGGPNLGEIVLARTDDGTVMAGQSRSWMIGQRADETVLADVETGKLFRLSSTQRGVFSLAHLRRNYDATVEGRVRSSLGMEAVVVSLTGRGTGAVRERLHIEPDSGLVLRRETFDDGGEPFRLVAYTALEFGSAEVPDVGAGWVEQEVEPVRTDISPRGVEIFRDMGWLVPRELDGGFRLLDAGAVGHGEGEGSSLHLLYTDGLYALSVYEQQGRLDERAVRGAGAQPVRLGAIGAYRWPGAEPAVMIWTAEGMTFTAVSDAPPDVLAAALAIFPHEAPARFTDRVRRGLSRAADVLWPFG